MGVRLFPSLPRGTSRRGATAGERAGAYMLRAVSNAGDFSAVSHRGQVGWRVYVAYRFYRMDADPARAGVLAGVFL